VLDEIQTGLARTGRWFALEEWGLEPDFVLVGKALSGGAMPVAAMATRREIHQRAVGTLERSYVHQSTFGRNRLSMAAGLATIRIIERDGLVEHAAHVGGMLREGLAELQARHEIVREIRGRGLMVGIELGAPRGSVARLSWRLVRVAAEGLYPQLIVIPLHRDHRVITMAAGKNDVIKLLPPLTLSEQEAQRFLDAFAVVLADCEGSTSKNWGVVREIAKATLRRRGQDPDAAAPRDTIAGGGGSSAVNGAHGRGAVPAQGRRATLVRGDGGVLITGATGFIGGRLAERLAGEGRPVRCLVRERSDTSSLEQLDVELALGDLTSGRSLSRAVDGCEFVFHCGALVSDWATTREITSTNVIGTRNVLEASADASVKRFVHFSTTDIYGHPGIGVVDESYACTRFSNWYAQTKLHAEGEVRRVEASSGLDAVILRPATVYGPGSCDVVGGIARAIRDRSMLLIDGGRSDAGLCFVENLLDAALLALENGQARGQAFNVSDDLGVTWRQFTDGLAEGLGFSRVRWSVPYWAANGVGTSLEHGYRLLRRATGVTVRPLLSRQAVQVLGRDQSFSSRRARETLGWEPRVDYAAGLEATVAWLRSEYLA